ELAALLDGATPAAAAVEDVFVKADPRAALAIGHGRGALLSVLGQTGVPVFDYAPATIKKAITGNGRADKTRVARMVGVLLGLAQPPEPLDATDALAAAITHSLRARTQPIIQK
ncbi:MAG: crossover junction endodeoxyribonuclease RuvC, partial [Planctomycetota bacterium]|nr:crossover junction endodeoxyribonuclease RuvC [Planctomycetota bacterium]